MATQNVALYAEVANRTRHRILDAVEASTPFYPTLAMTVQSDTDSEDYDWLGSFPGMREWLGDRKFHQLSSASFTIRNRTWESSIQLPKQKIDDGKTGYFDNLADGLAREASYHPDELLLEVIAAGETTEAFDGQYFFDTDHSWGDSGTQSNDVTYTSSTPADPTEEQVRGAVQAAIVAMMGFKRDNGKPYMRPRIEKPDGIVCVIPLKYFAAFDKAFNQVVIAESNAGVTNYNFVRPTIIPLASMTENKFYTFHVNDPLKPFVFQDRQPLGFDTKGADDREWKDIKVFGDARYNIGYLAWWKAVLTTFTV